MAAPSPHSSRLPERLVLGAALAVFLAGATRLFTASDRAFVTSYTHDDSYYYFQVSRNLARGLGPSFDGLEWTNGFTPVWGAVLVPVFALVDDAGLAARSACALGLAFFAAAIVVVARLLAPTFGRWPAAVAGTCALLSGPLRDLAQLGMDFSFNLFQEATLVCAFVALRRAGPRPGAGRALGVGVLAGLLCIQRPDTGLLPVLLTLPHVFGGAAGRRTAALLTAGALLVAVPWLGGSQLAFGTPLQVSGKLKAFNAAAVREREGLDGCVDTFLATAAGPPVQPLQAAMGGELTGADSLGAGVLRGLFVALVAVAAAGSVGAPGRAGRRRPSEAAVAAPLNVHGLLHAGVVAWALFPYAGYGNWYFAPETLAGVALLAAAARAVGDRLGAGVARGTAGFVLALAAGGAVVHEVAARRAPEPPDDGIETVALSVTRYLREELGRDTRIGVFNAGRIAYFADLHVVNLDGLVNTNAFAERVWMSEEGSFSARFVQYAVEKELEWFVDVWGEPMEMVRIYLRPRAREFFTLERTWPTRSTYASREPGSYQLVRFDVDAARAALRAATGER